LFFLSQKEIIGYFFPTNQAGVPSFLDR